MNSEHGENPPNKRNIVQTEDRQEYGLAQRYLFGLNLFDYNQVPCPIAQRPDVLFLKSLTKQVSCSAQIGALFLKDCVNAPDEMFGPPNDSRSATPYYMVQQVGFYDGFYDLQGGIAYEMHWVDGQPVLSEMRYGDCFFPHVTPAFWETLQREEGDLAQLIFCHALALYVAPKTETAEGAMEVFLNEPFAGEELFLSTATDLYTVVLLLGHDGQFFRAFAKNAADFAVLEPALANAVQAVENSDWFQDNKNRLTWSTNLDACLMLPP